MNTLIDVLHQQFPDTQFQTEYVLTPLTTVKIGGPAEVFCEVHTQKDLIELTQFCRKENIPVTMLGWGANTLISDRGIRGLVIKYRNQNIQILSEDASSFTPIIVTDRWQAEKQEDTQETFDDLNYSESESQKVVVEIDAGVPLPFAINDLISKGITGLQWFARIPATVGGAIYNNIHGGRHFMSEFVRSILVINEQGNITTLLADQLEFEYDYSRLHHTNEVIISAQFVLTKGDIDKAKSVVQKWSVQKKHQPQNSLGCVFQNISKEDQQKLGYPTPSVGYIVEHILHKKGFRVGDAMISEKHAAFIENVGQATAKDYLEVIKTVIQEIKEKTNLTIKPEIFFKGFSEEELAFFHD